LMTRRVLKNLRFGNSGTSSSQLHHEFNLERIAYPTTTVKKSTQFQGSLR
jgi:hypothetical protein